MSLINQDVRFAERGDANNPTAIYSQYKPVRFLTGNGVPSPALGEDCHHYIDEATSIEYVKRSGAWVPLVNYATIVAPSLPPATLPDNITADTLDNKNTNDLAISAVAALSLSGGSLDIDATGDILIDSVTDLIVTSANGKVELQGQYLSLQSSGPIPTQINSLVGGLVIQGPAATSLAMTGNDVRIDAGPSGKIISNSGQGTEFSGQALSGIAAINGSDSITQYKNLGVNLSSALEFLEPCDSVQGVIPNITAAIGSQYWEVGVSTSPADFFTISLPTSAAQNRKLVGLSAHFLHNAASWQILAGAITIEVGYIPVGSAPIVANIAPLWSSSAFQTATDYPVISSPQIVTAPTLPTNSTIVVYALKGPGVILSAVNADISLCLKFL